MREDKMKEYIVECSFQITVDTEKEAITKYWDIINQTDYLVIPTVTEVKER